MSAPSDEPGSTQEFEALIEFLKNNRGCDFTGYKRSSLRRRIGKRMLTLHIERYGDYLDYLEVHPEVYGKSLLNMDIGVPVEQLRPQVRAVLSGSSTFQEVVLQATNRRGKAIQCRVTCTPLLGAEGDTQGVILLMEEWSGHV